MENLLAALATKISGSALSSDVGGRIYLDQYPPDEMPATYPYVIYFIITDVPEKTFTENFENILIQFSLFSASAGLTEITSMYKDLKALFDECAFTIPPTGTETDKLVWMKRENLTTMVDEIIVADATQSVKHWAVDFEVKTEAV